MKQTLLRHLTASLALLFAGGTVLDAAEPATSTVAAEVAAIRKRYAQSRERIQQLIGLRLNPVALPSNLPNPFYQTPPGLEVPIETVETAPVPQAADLTDIDTLRLYALGLKIGGYLMLNGVPHLSINNTASKEGDVIAVGDKDRPTYIRIVQISPREVTLSLNDAEFTMAVLK